MLDWKDDFAEPEGQPYGYYVYQVDGEDFWHAEILLDGKVIADNWLATKQQAYDWCEGKVGNETS